MSVAGLLVLKLLVNLTLWDAINAIPSIISVCVWSLGNTPGTWSCTPLQGHSWQYIRHPGKACGYMPAISCYLISGRALLVNASVTNQCSLSLSHLLGILHSTSQRQHLRASIHHGFNYKEQGSSDSLIHV